MLQGLSALLPRIAADDLPEAAVYASERLYAAALPKRVRPGILACPICRLTAARFLPFGLDQRRNSRCPHCGSVERHRFLWLYVTGRTDLLRGRYRVLHTAPESFLEQRLRALPNLRYVSVDRFNPFADRQADLTALPFATASFDVILSSHVLEHVPEHERAIAELARVLRPGGWGIVMVPFDPKRPQTDEGADVTSPAERLRRFGHPYHYRIYGADLVDRLAAAGFDVTVVASKRLLTPHQRRRWRINANYLFHLRRREPFASFNGQTN